MAASINDKFTKGTNSSRPVPTTLTALKGIGDASISCGALTGWPTDTAVHFIIYTTDVNGVKVAGSQTDWKGVVSGTTITGLVLKAGTDNGYSIGAIVEASPTAAWANDMVAGMTAEHNQDGTHGTMTADNLTVDGTTTLTGNLDVNDSSTAIRDSSDNELVKFAKTASAVNEITVTNAATGNAPTISTTGGDTNINLKLAGKGTGYPYLYAIPSFAAIVASGQSISATTYTKANYATEEYDTCGNYDTTTSKFTAPITGIYTFSAGIANTGTSVTGRTTFAVNGTQNRQSAFISTAGYYNNNLTSDMKLTAGDTVEVQVYFVSGVTTSTGAACFFTGHLVSATA